jgi:hypothetical protein
LKPWRFKMWCIPPEHNAAFVCALENVLEVYHRLYDPDCPVVCMDELSKQLVGETRVPVAVAPGLPARFDYEYVRNGTANLFLFTEPLAGWRHVAVTDRRTAVDWAWQVRELLDVRYPTAKRVTLVSDNLNTHTQASLYEAFEPAEARRLMKRLELVHTPKHGSWLNIAELELNVLTRQCLDRRIEDKDTLIHETAAWDDERNAQQTGVDWQFTTADARVKLKRLYPQIQS